MVQSHERQYPGAPLAVSEAKLPRGTLTEIRVVTRRAPCIEPIPIVASIADYDATTHTAPASLHMAAQTIPSKPIPVISTVLSFKLHARRIAPAAVAVSVAYLRNCAGVVNLRNKATEDISPHDPGALEQRNLP